VHRQHENRDAFYAAVHGQVDPMNYAGENFTATDEIPLPSDVDNPWIRGKIENDGDYWPGPKRRK
jgi:hypothetical protein